MAVQTLIIAEADESEQKLSISVDRRLFSSKLKPFFSDRLSAFQSALLKNVSTNQNASAGAHTRQLERDCKKKVKEVMAAALWSWSSALHLFIQWKPVIFTRLTKLTTKPLAPFLRSSHIHVEQNEASMCLTCLNQVVLAVRYRICFRQKKKNK